MRPWSRDDLIGAECCKPIPGIEDRTPRVMDRRGLAIGQRNDPTCTPGHLVIWDRSRCRGLTPLVWAPSPEG